jgi:hypothetical protein
MVNVSSDLDTMRRRVGLKPDDIEDADISKYVVEACGFLNEQLAGTIDATSCTEAEAEAIRNLAAIKCFFDVTNVTSTSWLMSLGGITFSGAPEKIAMINWLWSRVKDFLDHRRAILDLSTFKSASAFKVGAANY